MAAIELHVIDSFPLYCAEAYSRVRYYHPPYIYGWLYYDGDRHGTINYALWRDKITTRMAIPAPVTITMWGDYSSVDGTGTINVQFRNDSTSSITGRVIMVVTEDSIFQIAPNNDSLHNHVARDYLPDDSGSVITIQAGDSVIVSESFTIPGSWDEDLCEIYTWIQNDSVYVDSTKEIWQGCMIKVTELIGVNEEKPREIIANDIYLKPNPCVSGAEFSFTLASLEQYSIEIFDITGRCIKVIRGTATGNREKAMWDRKDSSGFPVNPGVYFYLFTGGVYKKSGKIIVR